MVARIARQSSAVILVLLALLSIVGALKGRQDRTRQLNMTTDGSRAQMIAALPGAVEAVVVGRFLDPAALDDARSGVDKLRLPRQRLLERDIEGCALATAWAFDTGDKIVIVGEFDDSKTCVSDFSYRAYFLLDE